MGPIIEGMYALWLNEPQPWGTTRSGVTGPRKRPKNRSYDGILGIRYIANRKFIFCSILEMESLLRIFGDVSKMLRNGKG